MNLPWAPLFTIERSGQPEITISGVISVWEGDFQPLLAVGDQEAIIWSRSLLKPWQLLALLPALKESYPHLNPHHFAMMVSSHNAEPWHQEYLKELLMFGGIDENQLKCPACYPMAADIRVQLEASGEKPRALFNPCSGKHSAYLLMRKALGQSLDDYLNPHNRQFEELKELLSFVLKKDSPAFPEAMDGCKLPNYGFSGPQLARLYGALVRDLPERSLEPAPAHLQPALREWTFIRELMIQYPKLIGGTNRLDSRLMSGQVSSDKELHIVAKEGADGLLGVGISPAGRFEGGLGIFIKLASGYDPRYLEMVLCAILEQLGLRQPDLEAEPLALKTEFYFRIPKPQPA